MKKLIFSMSFLFTFSCVNAQSSFMAPNYVPEYTPYQSTIDLKLYERVITEKQNAYDNNLQIIRTEIKQLGEYLLDLKEINYDDYKYYSSEFDKWVTGVNKSNPDLANKQVAQAMLNTISLYTQAVRKSIRTGR